MIVSSGPEPQVFTEAANYLQNESQHSVSGSTMQSTMQNSQVHGSHLEAESVKGSMVVPRTLAHPRRKLGKDCSLYETGKEASELYIVNQGLLKAVVPTAMGRNRIADIYGPGDLLGFASIEGGQHVETVVALHNSVLTPIDPRLALVHPKSSRFVANALAKQMRRHREAIDDAELPVGARLTRILLRMCERFGERHSAKLVRLPIALTHEDFAAFTGSSRVTITRILGELRQIGALKGGRGIYEANPALLEKATDQFVLKVL